SCSFRSPRRAHVRRERWPAWIAWRGCERARRGVYRTRDEGGRRGHAVTQIGRARTLTGGVVEASVIPIVSAGRNGESKTAPRSRASARLVRIQATNQGGTMGSFPSWFRAAPLVRRQPSVFAVGRRVYVASAGDGLTHVALTDDAGADARTH